MICCLSSVNSSEEVVEVQEVELKAPDYTPRLQEIEEVEKLKKDILDFTERAVDGVFCTILRERTRQRVPGLWCLDECASHVIFLTGDNYQTKELVFPLKDLQYVYSLEADGDVCFPPAVLQMLQPGEGERLIMLGYYGDWSEKITGERVNALIRFCFLETDREAQDLFTRCMKVLRVYAQADQEQRTT
mmetsp:Transcript_123520/g.193832  ORF Transcript_123520/g.193832 Transcript_123520/m.193832 type:complete len:189 (+) Transcript_123520:149-715(+)